MHTLSLNEETGKVEVSLPEYQEDEPVSFSSLLFVALAMKLSDDSEWAKGLVEELHEEIVIKEEGDDQAS